MSDDVLERRQVEDVFALDPVADARNLVVHHFLVLEGDYLFSLKATKHSVSRPKGDIGGSKYAWINRPEHPERIQW